MRGAVDAVEAQTTLDTNLARSQFVVSLIWSNICKDGGKQISERRKGATRRPMDAEGG